MCGRLVCRAARYGYSIVDKVIICRCRNFGCRHRKGDFGFGLVVHGYAFNRPARELLARFGRVCFNFDGCTLGIFAAARAVCNGYGICSGRIVFVIILILAAGGKNGQ